MPQYTLKPKHLDMSLGFPPDNPKENCILEVLGDDGNIKLATGVSDAEGMFSGVEWDVVDPYVAPILTPSSSELIVTGGLRSERVSGTSTQNSRTMDGVINSSENSDVIVAQYNGINLNRVQIQLADTTADTYPQVDGFEVRSDAVNVRVAGVWQSIPATVGNSGTIVFNLIQKEVVNFDSSGNLIDTATYAGDFSENMFLSVLHYQDNVGDYLQYFCDKTTMPYDLEVGDLGVYLAANPHWKQVGETSSGHAIDPLANVIACYYYESPPPYVEPNLEYVSGSGGSLSDRTITTNGGSSYFARSAAIINYSIPYVFQFSSSSLTAYARVGVSEDGTLTGGQNAVLNARHNSNQNVVFFATTVSSNTSTTSPVVSGGTVVFDAINNRFDIYNELGVLVQDLSSELSSYPFTLPRSGYVVIGTDNFNSSGGELQAYFDKTTFPHVLPSGLPVEWQQVGETNTGSGIKHPPRAIVASPVDVPYVSPVLDDITNPSNVTVEGLKVTWNTTSSATALTSAAYQPSEIYVFQFTHTFTANIMQLGLYSSSGTNASDLFATYPLSPTNRGFAWVDGAQYFGSPTGGVNNSGTVVLDFINKNLLIYHSDGSLDSSVSWSQDALREVFLGISTFSNTVTIGNYAELYTDKTLFPNDVSLGDLGVYLAANPDWKQVGES